MKTYKTQEEFDKEIKDGRFYFYSDEDIKFEFNLVTSANIDAHNIDALDITAHDITAHDINAYNITAHDITANTINALNINAYDITANNIIAYDITANNISYFAVAFAYNSFTVHLIKGYRKNSKHFCLDKEIKII